VVDCLSKLLTSTGKEERLGFLQSVAETIDKKTSPAARAYAEVEVARGNLDDVRKDLDDVERALDMLDSVDNIVNAAFYDVNADYYNVSFVPDKINTLIGVLIFPQRKEDFAAYYRNALLYLACVDINAMTPEERRSRAWRLAIAALVSNSIYNFGELLLHPILDALSPITSTSTSTPSIAQTAAARTSQDDDAWLRELLFAFNRGDLPSYDALVDRIAAHGVLGQHQQHLAQKIHLSCLTEAVFRRPTHERAMTFSDLSAETRIRPEEIEHLLMKALSLGLVRGTIDQVDAVAHITWVQPKVLDMAQIESMRQRLLDWDSTVNQLGHWIESAGQDVWAA